MIFARPLPKSEEFVDYNSRPLNLLGYTTADVKLWKNPIKNARVVIAREGKKSPIRARLAGQIELRVAESNKTSEYNIV